MTTWTTCKICSKEIGMKYISDLNTPASEIVAGRIEGTLIPWRIDASGRQWYRHLPPVLGVPPADTEGRASYLYDDEDFRDDDFID
jgi:hypothetical protein